jgi:hypothetical protein
VTIEKCEARIVQLRRQRDDIDMAMGELVTFIDEVRAAGEGDAD